MLRTELSDHAIAHLVEQKQVERQLVENVAEVNAFYEEEKLDTGNAPPLHKLDLADLP